MSCHQEPDAEVVFYMKGDGVLQSMVLDQWLRYLLCTVTTSLSKYPLQEQYFP